MATISNTTRFPLGRPQITAEQIRGSLQQLERAFYTRWISLISLGSIVTMLGPILIGSIIWGKQFSVTYTGSVQSWTFCVGEASLIVLPILFLIEWLTRGKLVEDAADSMGDMGMMRFSPYMGRGMGGLIVLEICLWGPRIVIAGTKRIAEMSKHAAADRSIAAEMLHLLVLRGEGISTGELYVLVQNRDDLFSGVLAYLLFFDLIGVAKAGDRAWLAGSAMRELKLNAISATNPSPR